VCLLCVVSSSGVENARKEWYVVSNGAKRSEKSPDTNNEQERIYESVCLLCVVSSSGVENARKEWYVISNGAKRSEKSHVRIANHIRICIFIRVILIRWDEEKSLLFG